jgi:nucleobase:cation symporter-1, NCS1 family
MPGFVCAVNGHQIAEGWTRIYQLSYFVGLILAIPSYVLINWLSPPAGLGVMETMGEYAEVIEGRVPGYGGGWETEKEGGGEMKGAVSAAFEA